MKTTRRTIKTITCLLLALLLCAEGLLPAAVNVASQPSETIHANGLQYAIAEDGAGGTQDGSTGGTTGGTTAGTNDLDGSRIEGIKVVWITPDSTTNNDGVPTSQAERADATHLYIATASASPQRMVYKIEVEFSGQYDYGPGDITITIPAQVWHGRKYVPTGVEGETVGVVDENTLLGSLALPLPQAPSTKADFNWEIVGDNYVLTNTRTIGATSSVSIEVAITNVLPMDVVDMSETDPITARCEVVTSLGNTIELTSTPISAQMDTCAKITSAYKNGEVFEDRPSGLPQSLLSNLPAGADPDDYLYVRWYTYHSRKNNQPFSLDVGDVLSDAYEYTTDENGQKVTRKVTDGIFLGSSNYAGAPVIAGEYMGAKLPEDQLDYTAEVADHVHTATTGTQYSHTVNLWSAYKKSDFYVPHASEAPRVYYFRNDAEWILTESDGAVEVDQYEKPADPQKVTTAADDVELRYAPVRYGRPTGNFAVNKWTEQVGYKDWSYGYALNQLQSGKPVTMDFVVETIGYGWPWTSPLTNGESYNDLSYASGNSALDTQDITQENFGLLGWKQVTHDFQTFFNYETTPLTAKDFEMNGLRIGTPYKKRYAKKGDGTWDYVNDSNLPNPDLLIEYQLNNEDTWHTAAIATWGELDANGNQQGDFRFVDVNENCTTSGMTVYFPENVTDVRHTFVSNVFGGKSPERCEIAQIDWYVYPIITMKPSQRAQQIVAELFDKSENPSTKFKNDVNMSAYGWIGEGSEGAHVYTDYESSLATYAGASYGVALNKSGTASTDVENQRMLIRYTATVTEQSNLKVRSEYDAAVEDGVIPAETSGVWYDLLPPHVVPMLDTVKLRSGDIINNVYTIENFRDTGRTLLVVEADLAPKPANSNGIGYADMPTLTFTAFYTWLDMEQYGKELVNYVAFESTVDGLRNNTLGTIKNQKGEPDNPLAGNNATTPDMPDDIAQALTGLDPNTQPGENRFVYGKCANTVSSLTYAVSGLEKAVSNDLYGIWTQGLDGQEQVTVYEGHPYSYRLRVSSSENTVTKGIIIYDTIENYIIPDPSADEDTDITKAEDYQHTKDRENWSGAWQGKGQWRGTLEKVDLTEFVSEGVAPVLLYSVLPNLQFADSASGSTDDNFDEDTELFASGNYDITNREIWQVAQLDENGIWVVPDGLNVTAIAIDASTNADGTEFVLQPEQTIAGYLRMSAPDDNADPDVWNAKGAYARNEDGTVDWDAALDPENNMYAFNNARVRLIQGQSDENGVNWLSSYRMIRNDYTRVGIIPGVIELEKVWQDQNNHDNMRPDEVTVTVQRRIAGSADEPVDVLGPDGQPLTATMNEGNNWYWRFNQIDVVNEQGERYLYSFKENPVEGYEAKAEFLDMNHYRLINVHPNEQVVLSGEKIWADDNNAYGQRPEKIQLTLYRDDKAIDTITVWPDAQGLWTYSFGKMDKYAEGGIAYEYRVEEEYVPKYADEVEGFSSITNTWLPYGDLTITKTVVNATEKALEKSFTFTLVLLGEQTDPSAPAVPLMDKYTYLLQEKQNEEWVTIQEGEIGNGDTFQLKHGQQLVVKDLPSETTYQVVETEASGFTVTSTNAVGFIHAGESNPADFTNTYAATGTSQLTVVKTLTGHEIRKNQFRFELVDNNPDSPTYGQVLRTARVNAPEEGATTGGSGENVIESAADALFGQLEFTEADVGASYQYIVREKDLENDGYGYDTAQYDVTLTITDETGDGNLTVTPTFTKDGSPTDGLAFENTYTAVGHLDLKAWKVLDARPLQDGEFTFELYRYDTTTQDKTGDPIATATNDAEGNVVFAALNADGSVNIPELNFDQNSISLNDDEPAVYTFLMREKQGRDSTVVYSNQEYVFTVMVFDNGDGTLSFAQGTQGYEREYVTCPECLGDGYASFQYNLQQHSNAFWRGLWSNGGATSPKIFIKFCPQCDGQAKINGEWCTFCGGSGLAENQEFSITRNRRTTFYTGTVNEDTRYHLSGGYGLAIYPEGSTTKWHIQLLPNKIEYCDVCNREGVVDNGMTITGENTIPVFENTLKPGSLSITKQVQGDGSSNPNQEFTFHVKLTGEVPAELDYELSQAPVEEPPAPASEPAAASVPALASETGDAQPAAEATEPNYYVATDLSGKPYARLDLREGSDTYGELVIFRATDDNKVDFEGINFSSARETDHNYPGCMPMDSGLIYYKLSETQNYSYSGYKTEYPWVMRNAYACAITSVRMTGDFRPVSCDGMFDGCLYVKSIDLSRLDTSQCNSTRAMFDNCQSLQEVDVSGFDTSNVTNMQGMFNQCHSLDTIDVSGFDTGNVTNFQNMFSGCRNVTDLDVSGFDTRCATRMGSMFSDCSNVTELDVSGFDTSSVTGMAAMFSGCSSLTALDVSGFDTSSVTSMSSMFRDCTKLATLDVSGFDTSKVTSFYYMFSRSKALTVLDLSNWNTSLVTDVSYMFENCTGLIELDLSGWDTSSLTSYSYMLNGCSSTKKINLTGFDLGIVGNTVSSGSYTGINMLNTGTAGNAERHFIFGDNFMDVGTGYRYLFNYATILYFGRITLTDTTYINEYRSTNPPNDSTYTGKWVNVDDPTWTATTNELLEGLNHGGTWEWQRRNYKVQFEAGGGGGSMPSLESQCGKDLSFTNGFYNFGYRLTGFSDGKGHTFAVDQTGMVTIPANTYYTSDSAVVTLTAQWEEIDTTVNVTEDGFTITLKEGETATFKDLPAGTAYEVWEDTPNGWVLIAQENVSGEIMPTETSAALFTNEYNPKKITVALRAGKLLDGDVAKESYTFTLSQNNTVLQTKQNNAAGSVAFDLLEYTRAGVYTYTIAEVPGSDSTIAYDGSTYTAVVTVTDDGKGKLSSTLVYQDAQGNTLADAPVFENTTKPGALTLQKISVGATGAAAAQSFKVQVAFTDHMDQPWSGKVLVGGSEVTIGADGLYTASLKGGESVTITEIPAGVNYLVTEPQALPGWQQTGAVGTEGTIQPTETALAQLQNTYTPTGFAQLGITKVLTGRTLAEDEFSFALYACRQDGTLLGDKLGTATNAADGSVVFSDLPALNFTQEGAYTFAIVEETPGTPDPTVAYSNEKIVATVTMTDTEGKGKLQASVAYSPEAATITNQVVPGNLSVSKQVVSPNAAHQSQPFTFTLLLTDALGQPISGSYQLDRGGDLSAITLSSGRGSFVLTHGETITIMGLPHGASYTVTEAAAGGFTSTATGATGSIAANQTASAAFTNTYAATGSYAPTAQKSLTGKALEADAFVFVLMDEEGYELSTGRNAADGSITFPALNFTLADVGTKVIQITERDTGAPGITYDDVVQTITLTIADNGDGTLSVTDGLNGQPVLFTNTYNDKISHKVEKVWQDNENAMGVRPESVTAILYRNRVEVERIQLSEENNWAHTFADLPSFDEQGVKYTYEVQEEPVPGYSSNVSMQGNATTLTNTALGVLEVSKTVADGSDETAFTFTVTLTDVDGAPVTGTYPATGPEGALDMVLDENGQCQFQLHHGESMQIAGLPLGAAYTVTEEENVAYSSEVTQGNAEGILQRNELSSVGFTNTIVITSLSITKQWEGGSGYIELMLYGNGELVDPQPSYTRDGDTYTYEMLPKYLPDGSLITYSVKEKYVDGYVTIYINEGEHESETDRVYDGGTILNRAVVTVRVRKIWKGLAEGEPQPKIRLVLYCNGEELTKSTPDPDEDGWYVYKNLPRYYKGEEAVYTFVEVPMDGFDTKYINNGGNETDHAANGYTIINSKLPNTGDDMPVELAAGVAAVAACGLVLLLVLGKKKKR